MINILEQLSDNNIVVSFATEKDKESWEAVLKTKNFVSNRYDWNNLVYLNTYFSKESGYKQIPLIYFYKNKPVAVWPLAIINGVLSSHGGDVVEPLVIEGTPQKVRKQLFEMSYSFISSIENETACKPSPFGVILSNINLSEWAVYLHNQGMKCLSKQLLYVDLTCSLEEIKSSFRKSYRPLVTKGLRLWDSEVVTSSRDVFEEFMQLHHDVAGGWTRSRETWDLHYEMMVNGEAFLITLRDDNGVLVGAGFFVNNRTNACYAIAAYDRSLFKEPLGHVVQYKAIEYMISKGFKWYEIGENVSILDESTDKERNIVKFKSGFSNLSLAQLQFYR
ncbi:GNAT family N-acetyltransferase [Enterovibrio paralichthyis]|uniref:GNAT family N-acetyltransferase n=1 Tax=Enterovibrio paralichthyis TaxID=2853805 RepID=UPI001C48B8F6|nr:GNAT family N-acetyltransferase [Enterovibrio paralichthyis]MBV7298633.1 GNAT family N-acetyltransferase [Enterovibrio paralichthyis]